MKIKKEEYLSIIKAKEKALKEIKEGIYVNYTGIPLPSLENGLKQEIILLKEKIYESSKT